MPVREIGNHGGITPLRTRVHSKIRYIKMEYLVAHEPQDAHTAGAKPA